MAESQNIEWKESWRDEYLKWICGFANAQGGKIYIGVNDNGDVIGVKNAKRLLEEIPNKIQTTLGLVEDVNLLQKDGKDYIEIIVSPSAFPINYKGEYHYRSGSTKQQLKGNVLTQFLMVRTGHKWDEMITDRFSYEDLDDESFKIFRREAIKSKRMTPEDLNISNRELLDKLNLTVGGKLKRAAVLLFHPHPDRLVTGAYVKVGKFGQGADLQYYDELNGSLIWIADKVIDLIYLKYLKAKITYEKDIRVETYPFARDAIREAVYNALVHNNYAEGVPIQIRIEDDKIFVSNCYGIPFDCSIDDLLKNRKSVPYNPDIANTFFRAGYIESWGRGIQKIYDACDALGAPKPEYDTKAKMVSVKFDALESALIDVGGKDVGKDGGKDVGKDVGKELDLENVVLDAIRKDNSISAVKIAEEMNMSSRTIERTVASLKEKGVIKRVGGRKQGTWIIVKDEEK